MLTYFASKSLGRFSKSKTSPAFVSVPLCVIYAISDELHQTPVEGRFGRVSDVFIDSAGVVIGTVFAVCIAGAIMKKCGEGRRVKK